MYPHNQFYGMAPPYYVPPLNTVVVPVATESSQIPVSKESNIQRCGNMLSWKRVQGASGKLQAFGFCEYEDPESTMRCVRLFNGLKVGSKSFLVKVDPKTEDLLTEYKKNKEKSGEDGTLGSTTEEIDSTTLRDDESVKKSLKSVLEEHASILDGSDSPKRSDIYTEGPRHLTMEDMNLDDDRKDLINREIEIFRRRHENEDQGESRIVKSRDSRSTAASFSSFLDHEGRKEKGYSKRTRSRSAEKSRRSTTEVVDDEAELIHKKLERKFREKEESYQKRLKIWESREKKKANEYDHEKEHDRKRQRELQVEAQRLREFFEDYDDDTEDPKYYRGSALSQRLKDRSLEEASDERDRQKEVELLEASRRKLIDEGDPNAESVILTMEQKMYAHLHKRLNMNSNTGEPEITAKNDANNSPDQLSNSTSLDNDVAAPPVVEQEVVEPSATTSQFQPSDFVAAETIEQNSNDSINRDTSNPLLFSMPATGETNVRKKASAFTDEEHDEKPKRHTPSWLPPSAFKSNTTVTEEPNNQPSSTIGSDEKKLIIQQIIQAIPTGKRELFNYPIEWEFVDENFINNRIKPWVDKKIISYIGEAEATLSKFICERLLSHQRPERLLSDIAMVLDDEAEVFVVKMWRLLIFGIAEKKAGLA